MGIGHKIRALREARKMTQRELGEKAHVDQAALSALELRDSNRSQFIAPIARAFGVPLDEMLALSADELVEATFGLPKRAKL